MKPIYLLIIILMFSCDRNEKSNKFIKNNEFISEPGIYYHKSTKVIVKEFKDGSLIYGIADKRNNIIYQQSINQSFSDNGSWMIFIDTKDNIWFYTSDLQLTTVLVKQSETSSYVYKKITDNNTDIPNKMKSKMEVNKN